MKETVPPGNGNDLEEKEETSSSSSNEYWADASSSSDEENENTENNKDGISKAQTLLMGQFPIALHSRRRKRQRSEVPDHRNHDAQFQLGVCRRARRSPIHPDINPHLTRRINSHEFDPQDCSSRNNIKSIFPFWNPDALRKEGDPRSVSQT